MKTTFLTFAEEVIAKAMDNNGFTYDFDTRNEFDYDFDEDNNKEMHAMGAIASVYGFTFMPIVDKAETKWDNDMVVGFTLSK